MAGPRIAVLIPCFNEEATVETVVRDFRAALPEATVYVYDNNSTDRTAALAREAGAVVRAERRQGKGYVVRRMFADIDADAYLMVDGDNTYDAASAPELVGMLLEERLDMVCGSRKAEAAGSYPTGHRLGNRLLTGLVRQLFGQRFKDMLTGYRCMSRRFVKSFPSLSEGFETETELTIHALSLDLPVAEIETPYGERPTGSESKLSTFRDGFRILFLIVKLLRLERPLYFFGLIAAALATASLALGIPVVFEFLETGLVPRFPTAILASALGIIAVVAYFTGLI
ncbi:MAG: glycosyltransferase family 2 protein, partial [Deltaproteobacteria bacterium]|nr:glycosyltransferase family 2 protein [Deltaproteobacteria bacterium]